MPTIEVAYDDLQTLIGKHVPLDVLQEKGILYAKGEIDEMDGEMLKIDIKDTNRPDLWSAEGIAREIAGRYGSPGLPKYSVGKPKLKVLVNSKVKKVRPYTVCAVVRGLRIDENVLSQMIQLQEKVAETFGKKRKEVAIGVYDFHKIKGPIKFTTVKPEGIKFVPLEFDKPMTPKKILEQHPKGKEYKHLLDGCKEYPIFIDSAGEVLSMPPIINSNYTGKVTSETRDVFIECSGFNLKWVSDALNVLVAALADRGGKVGGVKVVYPKSYGSHGKTIVTPDLKPKKFSVNAKDINKIIGFKLSNREIIDLLKKARYSAKVKGSHIDVEYPAYRQDIMHWRDIVEDVIISYGYDEIEPIPPKLATIGNESATEIFSKKVAGTMAGLGLQEVMSYMLTNNSNIFKKMEHAGKSVEIENIVSANWSVFRTWLLPNLLEVLAKNKHIDYPQRLYEVGYVIVPDDTQETKTRDDKKLGCVLSNPIIGYENISTLLDALLSTLDIKYEFGKATKCPLFLVSTLQK